MQHLPPFHLVKVVPLLSARENVQQVLKANAMRRGVKTDSLPSAWTANTQPVRSADGQRQERRGTWAVAATAARPWSEASCWANASIIPTKKYRMKPSTTRPHTRREGPACLAEYCRPPAVGGGGIACLVEPTPTEDRLLARTNAAMKDV